MNCSEIRPLLSAYYDGEATPEERVQVERHLARCEECRHTLAEYRAIGSDIRALPLPVPPAGLRRDVWRAITHQGGYPARQAGRPAAGGTSGGSKVITLPQGERKLTPAAILAGMGSGWAKALPAALLIGGLLLVMAILITRPFDTRVAAVTIDDPQPFENYNGPVRVAFNKQVIPDDAEDYTYVRELVGTTPYTVENVIKTFRQSSATTGVLEIKPAEPWKPGSKYQVYVDAPRMGTGVANQRYGEEPVSLILDVAAHTPTPTSTPTNTPTATDTPVPTNTPKVEPTAVAQITPGVVEPTEEPAAPSPTQAPQPSATPIVGQPTSTSVPASPTAVVATNTPAPSATPTPQPSGTPTATHVPVTPTATPGKNVTPTATSVPAGKNTPTPRATTTAEPCVEMPVRGFGKVWQENPAARRQIGCPTAPELGITGNAYQRFEGGAMFWREDTRTIYVFIGNPKDQYGVWKEYADTWREGDPMPQPTVTPPAGRYTPIRGFGKLWYGDASLRLALGYAIEPEALVGAVWQPYERGMALWTSDRIIRFMYQGGLYERFDDTFEQP